MSHRWILILLVFAVSAGGCVTSYPQTLRFTENSAVIGETKLTADLRYHFGNGWDMPALPGTYDAQEREMCLRTPGGGMQFRLFADASYREVKEEDEVRAGEFAAVGDGVFSPGIVDGTFRVNRENVGFNFGFFTDKFIFGGGFGFFFTGIQVNGSVRNATDRGSMHNQNTGFGFNIQLELSPGYPPLKAYFDYKTWTAYEGKGYFKGDEWELGVKFQFRSFLVFAGYRQEQFNGRATHNTITQSRLKFKVQGPVIGVGLGL